MCIADWQIGRLIRAVSRQIDLGANPAAFLPANKDRVALTVINNDDNYMWIMPDLDAGNTLGFVLSPATGVATTLPNLSGQLDANTDIVAMTSANNVISADYSGTVGVPAQNIALFTSGSAAFPVVAVALHFTLKEYGDLPMRRWSAAATGTRSLLTVIEYFLPESVLSLTPEALAKMAR